MKPEKIDPQALPAEDFEWYGEPSNEPTAPKEIPDEPPLEQLHEDEWAWLVSYKFDEWVELVARPQRSITVSVGSAPRDVTRIERRKETFEFVKSMYDQGLPPDQWDGPIPFNAAKYAVLNRSCSDAQKAYLQGVASGEITPSFPDPSDEAEEHRGKPRQWS